MRFSDLVQLKEDGWMENLERYELRRENGPAAFWPVRVGGVHEDRFKCPGSGGSRRLSFVAELIPVFLS